MSVEKRGNRVMTPLWCAKDMVTVFRPAGHILEPCLGDGVFLAALKSANWTQIDYCEIDQGKDFLSWTTPVNWIITNPPYNLTRPFARHAFEIADDVVFLVPIRNVFSGFGFIEEIFKFGGMPHVRVYGTGGSLGFPMGNAIGAMHFQRDYRGPTRWSFYRAQHCERGQGARQRRGPAGGGSRGPATVRPSRG